MKIAQLKHQLNNITKLQAVSKTRFIGRCFTMPIDYYLRDGRSRFPMIITMDITLRCNLRCKMCYLKDSLNKKTDELTTREVFRFIDSVAPKKPSFYITGGEPFARGDILKIVEKIKGHGLICGMTTNGTLLKKNDILRLAKAGLNFLDVSIDGPERVHDKIRGVKGTFKRVTENLKLFNKHKGKTRVYINFTISPDNIGHMEYMLSLAKKLGVDGVKYHYLTFLTKRDIKAHRLVWKKLYNEEPKLSCYEREPETVDSKVLKKIQGIKSRAGKAGIDVLFRPDLSPEEIVKWYQDPFTLRQKCYYPYICTRIAPNGDVYPCQFIVKKVGNIRKDNLENIWNSPEYIYFRNSLKKFGGMFPGCARCCKL
jgi:radical SAM protein with 4Fe4S-binding SPASM domain